MNSVLGSGGSTNMLSSSSAAAGSDGDRNLPRSRPDSATVSPPIRWVASWSGFIAAERRADLVHQRQADRVLRRRRARSAAAGPPRWRRAPRRAGPAAGRPRRRARASARRTGRARTARARPTARRRTAGRRGWTGVSRWRLSSGRWTITCAVVRPLSEPRTMSIVLLPSRDVVSARQRPGFRPCRRRSARSRPDRRSRRACPVASTKPAAASTFGPIDPAGNCDAAQLLRGDPVQTPLVGRSPVRVDPVDVGGHDEQVGVDLPGQQLAGEVLVDDGLHPDQGRLAVGVGDQGRDPASAGADDDDVRGRAAPRMASSSKMCCGRGDGTTRRHDSPSCGTASPSPPRASAPVPRRRSARRTWSGSRTRGRPGRPRPSSGWSRTARWAGSSCAAPARGRSRSSPASGHRARRAWRARPPCTPRPAARADRPADRCRARAPARGRRRSRASAGAALRTFLRCTSVVIGSPRFSRALPPRATTTRMPAPPLTIRGWRP